jgi:YVTN family beta-propeller protein
VPVSARVASRCRLIQKLAGAPLLCPTLLPRATVGYPGLPPPAVLVQPTSDYFRRPIAGVDISYGAPWEGPGWRAHRWRNRPCCFFHFNVFRRAPGKRAIPPHARPAILGGKHGLLVRGREDAAYDALYSPNHVRFLWREAGVDWVATLHSYGETATEWLLGRLIASLRPVDAIGTSRAPGMAVGRTPNALVAQSGSIWVASLGRLLGSRPSAVHGTVYRISRSAARITARVHPGGGGGPHALAVAGGAVWAAMYSGIARIEPQSAKRTALVGRGRWPKSIAATAGRLWVSLGIPFIKNGALVSIDPETNRLAGGRLALGRAPAALATGAGALWVADELDGTLTRVDPARRRIVARVKVGRMPTAVAAGAGGIWVANTGDGTVSRVDPKSDRVVATFRVGSAPRGLAVGVGAVWVATTGDGRVRRIDPATGRITIVREGLVDPLALLVDSNAVWVATNDARLVRIRLS